MSEQARRELDEALERTRLRATRQGHGADDLQSIDLDCLPGDPRPGDLIDAVLEGTGLVAGEPVAKFFGNWMWEFDVPRDRWVAEIKPVIGPRIEALYARGIIRYGSW